MNARRPSPEAAPLAEWTGTERYAIVRRIGAGGMGTVYEAVDREQNQRLALKTLTKADQVDPSTLYRFKQEFRALADVRHRNLVRLHELVMADDGPAFFAMELLNGVDFLAHVTHVTHAEADGNAIITPSLSPRALTLLRAKEAPAGHVRAKGPEATVSCPADFERLRPALRQLVEGLEALHEAGILHRDVKPSNVLVTPEGRVVLLDFGVALDLHTHGSDAPDGEVVGTPRYMAPEQALGEALTPASDWYSLGTMLYEALVGTAPFTGAATLVLSQKVTRPPPAPSSRARGVPPDLDGLCQALLRIDPDERPGGREILRLLGATRSSAPAAAVVTVSRLPAGPLVGRSRELAFLREAFEETKLGRAVTVRVSGRAGIGKSSLVDQYLTGLLAGGAVNVLRGRAYERESIPYKAVDGVIDALTRTLIDLEEAEGPLPLPAHAWALSHLFPVLKRVPSIGALTGRAVDDAQRVRRRGFEALREIVSSLSQRRPLVVFVDDVHWGDTDSVALLHAMMRQPKAPALLLIVTFREEEAERSQFLREMNARWADSPSASGGSTSTEVESLKGPREVRDLVLGPLSLEESMELAHVRLGGGAAVATQAQAIARDASGSPLLVEELVRSNRLFSVDPMTPRLAITLDEMVESRLSELPADARRLAEIIAVAGHPISVALAAEAAAEEANDGAGAGEIANERLGVLQSARFIRVGYRGGHDVAEPVHDRLRETLVALLPPSVLREHHRRLARVLERTADVDPEAVVTHLLGAGEEAAGALLAERAAEQAEAKLAFDHAARLFQLALVTHLRAARAPAVDRAAQQRLRIRYARALEQGGRASEAGDAYLEAAANVPADAKTARIDRIELERAGAEQLLCCGRVDEGEGALRRVLADTGVNAPRSALGAVFWLVIYQVWLRVIGLRFREREAEEVSREDRVRVDALAAISVALGMVDVILGACVSARQRILVFAVGDRSQVLRALGVSLVHAAVEGRPEGGRREHETLSVARHLARKVGPGGEAFLGYSLAMTAFLRGNHLDSIEGYEASRRAAPQRLLVDSYGELFACLSCYYLGRLREQGRRAKRALREAEDRGDRYNSVSLHATVMVDQGLVADDPEASRRHLREAEAAWTQRGFHLQHWYLTYWTASVECYDGHPERGWQRVQRDAPALNRSFLLHARRIVVLSSYMGGRTAIAAALHDGSLGAHEKRARLAAAGKALRTLDKVHTRDAFAFAAILRASLAAAAGAAETVTLLREALRVCELRTLGLHASAVRRCLGRALAGDEGHDLVRTAEAALVAEGVKAPARLCTLLVPGSWDR